MESPDQLSQRRHAGNRRVGRVARTCAIAALVLAGVCVVTLASHPARRDFIEYWAAGKLLVHHSDPYSTANLFTLEKAHGYQGARAIIMLNPPWILFLAAPLGICGVRAGLFLWTLLAIGCVVAAVRLLNVPANGRALAYVFAPAVACLFSSQSSPFLLLGFALFLRFYSRRPFWAGASLLLMAIKPHLFFIFWAVLLVDAIYRRRLRIFAGFAASLAAASAFPLCFDPGIWQHYVAFALGYKTVRQASLPTASMLFRALIDVQAFWLLFIPSAAAVAWGLWYYGHNRRAWDWKIHGMLLMLVTILASPYSYFSDEIVLLPSILFALALADKRRYATWALLVINTIALCLVLRGHDLSSHAYLWTPITWLAWFLYAAYGVTSQGSKRGLQANSAELTPLESA